MKPIFSKLGLCLLGAAVLFGTASPAAASSLKSLARISLASYPTDWDGDGVRDGLVWGVVFRDVEDRALRFTDEKATVSLRLRSLEGPESPGEVLLERKGMAITSHAELNGLYPRHDWQRIAFKDIPADPAKHARRGWLEVTVTLPGHDPLHAIERFKTVLYPRSAILPSTPHIEVMNRKPFLVSEGRAPGLARVRLFGSPVDENKDGTKEAFVWWLAFRDERGRPVRFQNLPYTVDLTLRGRDGQVLHRQKGLAGTSHRSFPALFPGKGQHVPSSSLGSRKEGRLEATVQLGKRRYRAVESDFIALR